MPRRISAEEATRLGAVPVETPRRRISAAEAAQLGATEVSPEQPAEPAPIGRSDTEAALTGLAAGPLGALGAVVGNHIKADDFEPQKAIGAAVNGLSQGVTLGFGDEMEGVRGAMTNVGKGLRERLKTGADTTPSFGDAYRAARDADRTKNKESEASHPVVYGGAKFAGNVALPVPGTGATTLAGKVAGGAATGAGLGGVMAAGESDADLTKGDVGGFVKDTLKGAGGGALGGAIGGGVSHGFEKLGERFGKKASGIETQLRVDKVSEDLASAQGSYGHDVQDSNRALENLRTALADPASSTQLKADIQAFMKTPGYSQLVEQVGRNTLDAAPLKLGKMAASKQAIADAPALANKAVDAELAKSTLKEDVLPRVMHYAKPAVAALLGGATAGPAGAGAGGLLAAASGKPGRAISNLIAKPRFQIQANQALGTASDSMGAAIAASAPVIGANLTVDDETPLAKRFGSKRK